jgi:hypothetical protein
VEPKELKKLIKMCRELGVKSYKGDGFEFTLTDEAPVKETLKTYTQNESISTNFESDEPSIESLLFWSAGDEPTSEEDSAN